MSTVFAARRPSRSASSLAFSALDFSLRVRVEAHPPQRTIFASAEDLPVRELTADLAELVPPPRIRLFNAYNPGDHVLRIDSPYNDVLGAEQAVTRLLGPPPWNIQAALSIWRFLRAGRYYRAWKAAQILQKPFSPGLEAATNRLTDYIHQGGAGDGLGEQKWWTQEIDKRPVVWQTTEAGATEQLAVGIDPAEARRWAALALWYPALAPPAGVMPLEALQGQEIDGTPVGQIEGLHYAGGNVNLGPIAGEDGPSAAGTASHSYLQMKKFHEVWSGFRVLQRLFAQ
jgi:hypothetical protein